MSDKRGPVDGVLPPITLFTFFLEVGRLLPIPSTQILIYAERTPAWSGWTPQALGEMLARENRPEFSESLVPGTRFAFRDGPTTVGMPLYAAELAFSDWLEPTMPPEVWAHRQASRAQTGPTHRVRESVVALTRFVPEEEHPPSEQMTVRWLTQRFRELLAELNRVLDLLSFSAENWALGSLERRDLPALLPTLIQSTHADAELKIRASAFPMQLHDDFPIPEGVEGTHDRVAIETAVGVLNEGNRRLQPFEGAFRFLRAAGSERIAGDPTRAVIDLATAMELLFSQLIETGGAFASWDSARVQRALSDRALRRRVENHLGPLIGARINVLDPATPWGQWWSEGYGRRNDAVHRGRRVTDEDCRLAWSAATRLVEHIKSVLRLQGALAPVADMLDVLRLTSGEPPWLDRNLPVEIDWF